MTQIRIKRVYAAPEAVTGDGYRVFVDRLWPRGESHATFHYDMWAKDIAPGNELREWYHADPLNRWDGFETRYMHELEASPDARRFKDMMASHDVVTLLYGSRDTLHNNAVVLKKFLEK